MTIIKIDVKMEKNKYLKFVVYYVVSFLILSLIDYLIDKDFKLMKNIFLALTLGSMNIYFALKKEKKEKEN